MGRATAHLFLAISPCGLGEGSKGQISLNYKFNFNNFYTKLCVLTNIIYEAYRMGFSICRLGHALGVGLGVLRGRKFNSLRLSVMLHWTKFNLIWCVSYSTGGKPRNYHEIVLTQICSQATSGTRRGSFQAENWIKKGWCHVHFCFILQLRTNNGEIRQCSSV